MPTERKYEIETIINNALTEEDCYEWAQGNCTAHTAKLIRKYNIKLLKICDAVCEIDDFEVVQI